MQKTFGFLTQNWAAGETLTTERFRLWRDKTPFLVVATTIEELMQFRNALKLLLNEASEFFPSRLAASHCESELHGFCKSIV